MRVPRTIRSLRLLHLFRRFPTSGSSKMRPSIPDTVICSQGEYEMPEFDLGNTFNYGEMAALIAPTTVYGGAWTRRTVLHPDEWVAHEFAVVRRLYVRLGIADRTEIEFFDGGHQINSRCHLQFPTPSSQLARTIDM